MVSNKKSLLHELEQREQRERERAEWNKRRDVFNALSFAEQVDMARFVKRHAPDLAREVMQCRISLFEAYYEVQQAMAFLAELED